MARQFYDGYNECYENKNNLICENINNNFLSAFNLNSIFNDFNIDDIILLTIAIVLLHDGTDDPILLIIIGILFLVGII